MVGLSPSVCNTKVKEKLLCNIQPRNFRTALKTMKLYQHRAWLYLQWYVLKYMQKTCSW